MTPLLERGQELFGLQKAAEDAAKGRGQVVLLAGEAGIGKSRLIAQFLDQLPEGTIAATGNCQPFDTPRPLGPLFDMSLSLGPSFKEIVKAAVYDTDPFTELARAIGAIGPGVVLVFEDAQYADPASLDVIDFLCQRIASIKALIIITYRTDEISSDHPLAMLLGRCPSRFTSRVTLGPISQAATGELAQIFCISCDTISLAPSAILS